MAIANSPHRHQATRDAPPQDEHAAEAFITGAEAPTPVPTHKVPILIRLDGGLLARVDQAAKRRGISRSAWIGYQLSRVVDVDEG